MVGALQPGYVAELLGGEQARKELAELPCVVVAGLVPQLKRAYEEVDGFAKN